MVFNVLLFKKHQMKVPSYWCLGLNFTLHKQNMAIYQFKSKEKKKSWKILSSNVNILICTYIFTTAWTNSIIGNSTRPLSQRIIILVQDILTRVSWKSLYDIQSESAIQTLKKCVCFCGLPHWSWTKIRLIFCDHSNGWWFLRVCDDAKSITKKSKSVLGPFIRKSNFFYLPYKPWNMNED